MLEFKLLIMIINYSPGGADLNPYNAVSIFV